MIHSDQTTKFTNPMRPEGAPSSSPAPSAPPAASARESSAPAPARIRYDEDGAAVPPAAPSLPTADPEMPSAPAGAAALHAGETRMADRLPAGHPHRWTRARQEIFIEILAYSGCVSEAALAAGMSRESAYRLRRDPRHAAFAEAWECALVHAVQRMTDIAFERCFQGTVEELFDAAGELKALRRRRSDRLLIHMMQTHMSPLHGGRQEYSRLVDRAREHAMMVLPHVTGRLRDEGDPADPDAPAAPPRPTAKTPPAERAPGGNRKARRAAERAARKAGAGHAHDTGDRRAAES